MLATPEQRVGQFARSVESGWLGLIVALEDWDGEPMFRMHGVDEFCHLVAGLPLGDCVSETDTRWFAPDDVDLV